MGGVAHVRGEILCKQETLCQGCSRENTYGNPNEHCISFLTNQINQCALNCAADQKSNSGPKGKKDRKCLYVSNLPSDHYTTIDSNQLDELTKDDVVNLSKHNLTKNELSVLRYGLNFCPTPIKPERGGSSQRDIQCK